MSLGSEPWHVDRHDKVAKIARSISQDVGKRFKARLRKTYPPKTIKNKKGESVDIGECCCDWHYDVIMFFGEDESLQKKLIADIRDAYDDGIYLDEDEDWLDTFSDASVTFAKEMKTYAQIPRLSFKDTLEKGKIGRDISEVQW